MEPVINRFCLSSLSPPKSTGTSTPIGQHFVYWKSSMFANNENFPAPPHEDREVVKNDSTVSK